MRPSPGKCKPSRIGNRSPDCFAAARRNAGTVPAGVGFCRVHNHLGDASMAGAPDELILPVVEEHLVVGKKVVETGRVRVTAVTDEQPSVVRDTLVHTGVEIERTAIGEEVLAIPPVRDEGDTIVIPVVREELVVTKRLILVEEVRLRRTATTEAFAQEVTLRSQRAVIDRDPLP